MSRSKKASPHSSQRSKSGGLDPTGLSGAAELARALNNPDAFVIGGIGVLSILAVWLGKVDPVIAFGFSMAAIVIYALLSYLRLRSDRLLKEAQIDGLYGAGERSLESARKRDHSRLRDDRTGT